jgi:hypothetical protein
LLSLRFAEGQPINQQHHPKPRKRRASEALFGVSFAHLPRKANKKKWGERR